MENTGKISPRTVSVEFERVWERIRSQCCCGDERDEIKLKSGKNKKSRRRSRRFLLFLRSSAAGAVCRKWKISAIFRFQSRSRENLFLFNKNLKNNNKKNQKSKETYQKTISQKFKKKIDFK